MRPSPHNPSPKRLADATPATSLRQRAPLATRPADFARRTPFPKGNTHARVGRQVGKFSRVPDRSNFSVLKNKEKNWHSGDKGGAIVMPACALPPGWAEAAGPAGFPP